MKIEGPEKMVFPPAGQVKVQPEEKAREVASRPAVEKKEGLALSGEMRELRRLAQEAGEAELRKERVEALRAKILAGEYEVDEERIARAILRELEGEGQ